MNILISTLAILVCVLAFTDARIFPIVARPDNLSCPQAKTFFPTPRSEPQCETVNTCAADELCCNWFGTKHCLKGIVTTPKDGECPVGTVNPNEPCRQDFVGCQFDSECGGVEKCCKNINCGYNQCQAPRELKACTRKGCRDTAGPDCQVVELIQPNGPECGPICRVCGDKVTTPAPTAPTQAATDPRENLGCPVSPFFFPVEDSAPTCEEDTECASDEKCCFFGGAFRCKTGLVTTPRPGSCPNTPPLFPGCIADFPGCQFDSECSGTMKCCRNSVCGYSECRAQEETPRICTKIGCGQQAGPDCQIVELVRPNGPGCEPACQICRDPPTPSPKVCTEIGCGPQAGPDCQIVELVRPNGPGCEPACQICRDPPTPSPQVCTEIGCGPQAGPDCTSVELVRPNGPGCGPVCRVCKDKPVEPTPPTSSGCRWVNNNACLRSPVICERLRKWLCRTNTPVVPQIDDY